MNQNPNNFPDFDNDSNLSQSPTEWKKMQNFSRQKNQQIKADKKQMQKLFLSLLTIGLILGAGVSVGIIKILSWSGLTEKPQPTLHK
jgi:amino acid permease